MKRTTHRLLLLALAAGAIISCDTRLPTASRSLAPGTPPLVVIDSPVVNTQVNLGDSIFMLVTVSGGNSLRTLVLRADKLTGVKDLGTFLQSPRYNPVSVDFPPGTTDTTIRRYLKVIDANDQTLDSLLIMAIVTDSIGLVDTAFVRATIVSGPHVVIESPAANDSIPPGVGVSVSAHATDADGIGRITIHVTGDPSWITPLDKTLTQVYDGSSRDVTFTGIVQIPLDAAARSRVVVNASAVDAVRQPGSAAPIALFIRSAASIAAPRVTQVVPVISERSDTVLITASGQGIVAVGLIVRDPSGALISADTVNLPPPITSNVHLGIPLKLTLAQQGKHLAITAFAIDQTGKIGYAVRTTTAGSETVLANALADSTEVVYGQTYTMPLQGTVGDVVIDTLRGNVFLSNKSHNRLEVWSDSTHSFDPNGISVGSEPWGMTVSVSPDILLVANSGGTNISKVCIAIATCPGGVMGEDLPGRILTRNIYVFKVTESIDVAANKVTITVSDPISYSDRPQYIAQTATGRIFFSTVPTPTAANGTIRWLDPLKGPAPDPRIIWQYGNLEAGNSLDYIIFNLDSIIIAPTSALTNSPDGLYAWDHPYGKIVGDMCVVNIPPPPAPDPRAVCVQSTTNGIAGGTPDASIEAVIATMKRLGSDVEEKLRLDLATIGLTDTTFVASSFDKNWVAFGEGHTGTAGRVMMSNDPLVGGLPPQFPIFFSPHTTVADLTENASERVFGLALDMHGSTVASHGIQSYFASVDNPFHLRLQGIYDSFDDGAGIALHPEADGANTVPDTKRLAFVGSSSGRIEIVDIAHYNNRGSLALKNKIYGPLRASLRMKGDDSSIVLKLFALTVRGLIVIDLTAADIKPAH